jgi:hypothetical protein
MRDGIIAAVLRMDIMAAIPRIWRGRYINTIRGNGMDGDLK